MGKGRDHVKGDFERREQGDLRVEERDSVGDLDSGLGSGVGEEAAEEDGVDGGGPVLEGVEDELYVGILGDFVTNLATHDLLLQMALLTAPQQFCCFSRRGRRREREEKRKRERATVRVVCMYLSL